MREKKAGFTATELMIVVMILALLAAMALPAYRQARAKARRAVCINNLRQIQFAAEQYVFQAPETTSLTLGALSDFFKNLSAPSCPVDGTYIITITGGNPEVTCDFGGGHEL